MIRFCKNLYPAMYSCFVHSGLVSIATSPTVLVPSLVLVPLFAHVEVTSVFSHPGIELLTGRYHQNVQRYLSLKSLPKIDMMNKSEKSYKNVCF